jgi:cytochrome c553
MRSKRCIWSSLALVGMLGADLQPGWTQTPEERIPSCLACHGELGTSTNSEVPSLGGQKVPYMEIQLYLYREQMNRNDAMNEAMTGVRNEDLGIIAELLSRLPPPIGVKEGIDAARIDRGRTLIHQHRCDVCHNPDLSGRENVPRIACQREDYLLKVLRGYKDNTRPRYDASMGEVLRPITEQGIRDLAYFAARQP